eukprot:1832388-Prymnesium_polylepis.1
MVAEATFLEVERQRQELERTCDTRHDSTHASHPPPGFCAPELFCVSEGAKGTGVAPSPPLYNSNL